jgi:predicted nucleotidyltransferase
MTTDQLNRHIADYCATRSEIVACYLYGSRARGKDRLGSDVDLAFLLYGSVAAVEYYDL